MSTATKPSNYKHIAAWGRRSGSFAYHIHNQQDLACRSSAPITAIYEKYPPDGTGRTGFWATADEIAFEEMRALIERETKSIE